MAKITYTELKAQHSKAFNNFPCFFAFNEKQLEEGLKKLDVEKEDLFQSQGGMLYRKTDSKKLSDMLESFDEELNKNLKDDVFLFEAVLYEIANHEYVITGDLNAGLAILGLTKETLTEKQAEIVRSAVDKYMETAEA